MTSIRLSHLSKRLGNTLAVADVDLEVREGELFFLLGPSGCGKTTLLHLVAGLLWPDSGSIYLGDVDVSRVPTERRSAVMCFQSYALWPHLSVAENVSLALRERRVPRQECRERVREALALVQMEGYAERLPAELSGGQQQRVAIARAVAVRPRCLLLDEPLSNLDAKLRQEMRGEIRRVCRATGLTTVYVTHDRQEALSLADRIAILRDGRIAQVGTPRELFECPRSPFVAEFLGQANLIPATVTERVAAPPGDRSAYLLRLTTPLGELTVLSDDAGPRPGESVTLGIRPDQIRIAPGEAPASWGSGERSNRLAGRIVESWYLGEVGDYLVEAGSQRLRVTCRPPISAPSASVTVELPPETLRSLREGRSAEGC